MHLKLTLAYDGTRFRGWARQPGERTVEGVLTDALEGLFATVGKAGRGRPHRHRRPRARQRGVGRGQRRAPGGASDRGAERRPPVRRRGRPRRGGASGVPRPPLGSLALVSLPHLAAPRALAVRGRPLDVASAPARPAAPAGDGRDGSRASTTSAPSRRPRRSTRSSSARSRTPAGSTTETPSSSRSPPTRSCATWSARSSARCSCSIPTSSCSCSRAPPARQPARLRPPCGLYLVSVGYPDALSRGRWLRSGACASRSSSSISTAPSSTPARSSWPRCGTRRAPCSGARSPTRRLMATVGGPGPRGADARVRRRRPSRGARHASTARTTSRSTRGSSSSSGWTTF